MLHIFALMMCNCTGAFAKLWQYGTVGTSTSGKVFQKCPKTLNSADFHESLPQGKFASLEKYSETSKCLSSEESVSTAKVPGLGAVKLSASNRVKALTLD